jgi:hypothetical protein
MWIFSLAFWNNWAGGEELGMIIEVSETSLCLCFRFLEEREGEGSFRLVFGILRRRQILVIAR